MFSPERKTKPQDVSKPSADTGGKSSYYVWFLGSRESRGLRGAEYVRPVIRRLVDRVDAHAQKLTLQVSQRGIRVVQTPEKPARRGRGSSSGASPSPPRQRRYVGQTPPGGIPQEEIVRQFVPHSNVTCVIQGDYPDDDVVACIFLTPNNGVGGDCPLHVHCYRCDSPETAELLRSQLQSMVDLPENKAKFDEIESRLVEKGLIPKRTNFNRTASANSSSNLGSDGRSLGRSSDSSSDLGQNNRNSSGSNNSNNNSSQDKLVSLHESLAQELREKLNKGGAQKAVVSTATAKPLLLPPKDYDTMHRNRGDLKNAEKRRALNPAIVGEMAAAAASASSGSNNKAVGTSDNSSGIGSGHGSPVTTPDRNKECSDEDDDDGCYHDDDVSEELLEERETKLPTNNSSSKPLVQIQSYLDRDSQQQQQPLSNRFQQQKSNSGNVKKASHQEKKDVNLGRKSSFHEIQNKFKSLERRQQEEREEEERLRILAAAKPAVVERKHFQQKLEKALKKREDANEIKRSRSREEKPAVDESTSRMLESYLIRSRHRSTESPASNKRLSVASSGAPASNNRSQSKVRRQASRASNVSGAPVTNNYHRNMEAVGEFEKVWSWATEHTGSEVPLTRELSPEYKPRDRALSPNNKRNGNVLSPVEQRRSRGRPNGDQNRRDRGMSTPPAEMRRVSPSRQSSNGSRSRSQRPVHHHPPAFLSSIPQSPMLSQHHQFQQHQIRRAASPEMGRRGGDRPVLRREKTAVFDNRYPSLDLRNERRKTLYELQEEAAARMADLRRRSYHELSNPELLHPPVPGSSPIHPMINPHNFQHSGKKSKENKNKMAPPPPPPHHHPMMGMHPPHHPPWAGYPPPPPPGAPPPHMGPMRHHPAMGPPPPRFGMPMRPY